MKNGASDKTANRQSHDQYRQNPTHRLAPPFPCCTLTAGLVRGHFTTHEDKEMSHEWPTRGKKRLDRLGRLDDDVGIEEQPHQEAPNIAAISSSSSGESQPSETTALPFAIPTRFDAGLSSNAVNLATGCGSRTSTASASTRRSSTRTTTRASCGLPPWLTN